MIYDISSDFLESSMHYHSNRFLVTLTISGTHYNEEISQAMSDWEIYVNDWGNFPGKTNKSEDVAYDLYCKATNMIHDFLAPHLNKINRKYDIKIAYNKDDFGGSDEIYPNLVGENSFRSSFQIFYDKKLGKFIPDGFKSTK